MSFRAMPVLALVVCSSGFAQQTQSPSLEPDLELDLKQFQEQPANRTNDELQLDLKQFNPQQEKKSELELNLDQFNNKAQEPALSQQNSNGNKTGNTEPRLNLEQFGKDDGPSVNEVNVDINSDLTAVEKEKSGLDKINTTGSAAKKMDDTRTDGLEDGSGFNTVLVLLAAMITLFLFFRWRSRRRKRKKGAVSSRRRSPRRTYDETDTR